MVTWVITLVFWLHTIPLHAVAARQRKPYYLVPQPPCPPTILVTRMSQLSMTVMVAWWISHKRYYFTFVRIFIQQFRFKTQLEWFSTVSFLDLPDLAVLAQVVPALMHLTTDPVLHTYRLRIVSPSRVNHKLFGVSPQGHTLRPTLIDLVHRGVIKGLGIERRWRMGGYFYSLNVSTFRALR